MEAQVPPGMVAGSQFVVRAPDGNSILVTLPPGLSVGDKFHVAIPDAAPPAAAAPPAGPSAAPSAARSGTARSEADVKPEHLAKVSSLSNTELRALVKEAGLSSDDCMTYSSLRLRAAEAVERLLLPGAKLGPISKKLGLGAAATGAAEAARPASQERESSTRAAVEVRLSSQSAPAAAEAVVAAGGLAEAVLPGRERRRQAQRGFAPEEVEEAAEAVRVRARVRARVRVRRTLTLTLTLALALALALARRPRRPSTRGAPSPRRRRPR